ncbi:MAG: 16S rRNA (adenine(1518)-N(6)/adenine(1519)-N(6))-dimethyltransferase, partial [Candidatus Nanopelagicales bacterium]
LGEAELRVRAFAAIDAAFGQRRKVLRTALASWAGTPAAAEAALTGCGILPTARGETLSAADFACLAGGLGGVPTP